MSAVLIVVVLVVVALLAGAVVLGRTTYEVDNARDTEYLELEGNWIRYRVLGGGPPVLLVHGWLSSGRIWDGLAERLAQRFTVYTLDLSGFGDSDKPIAGYGVRYGSRLLYAFCAHFGITRAAVVGHDVGGAMAVKLAADHPDVVGRLVLVATPADEEQVDLPTGLWLATLPVVGPIFYTLGRYAGFVRQMWMRPFVSEPDDLADEVVEDAGRSTPAAATKTLQVTQREISRGRLVRQAGIIKVPALVIAGEEDQIVDPHALSDWDRAFPSVEVVLIDGVGHLPMIESAGEFNARVLAFLTGDPRYLETPTTATAETPVEHDLPGEDVPAAWSDDEDEPVLAPHREEQEDLSRPVREDAGVRHDEETLDLGREGLVRGESAEEPAGEARGRRPARRGEAEPEDEERPPRDPADLFQWPEAWKEFRPREPFDPDRVPEESRKEEDPGAEPEDRPKRSE